MTNRPGSSKSQITLGTKKNVTNNMFFKKSLCMQKCKKKNISLNTFSLISLTPDINFPQKDVILVQRHD